MQPTAWNKKGKDSKQSDVGSYTGDTVDSAQNGHGNEEKGKGRVERGFLESVCGSAGCRICAVRAGTRDDGCTES